MAEFFTAESLIALATLLLLEIVLGIDNIIFITILSDKLPDKDKPRARQIGIGLAVITRILLLLSIRAVIALDQYELLLGLSGKDLVLLLGGAFLIAKSTYEIHEKLEVHEKSEERIEKAPSTLIGVVLQIVLIDMVFSLDSVITAVGLTDKLPVMITAIVIAAGIMVLFAGIVSEFVKRHPTIKMLALALLILIGTLLVVEGWNPDLAHELHLKNYAYFAMAFALGVEVLNIQFRKKSAAPVKIHNQPTIASAAGTKSVQSGWADS